MSDKELFLMLLENKEKYEVFVDNDVVNFVNKEKYQKYEDNDYEGEYEEHCFNEYGYNLLNEVFQALGINSDLV